MPGSLCAEAGSTRRPFCSRLHQQAGGAVPHIPGRCPWDQDGAGPSPLLTPSLRCHPCGPQTPGILKPPTLSCPARGLHPLLEPQLPPLCRRLCPAAVGWGDVPVPVPGPPSRCSGPVSSDLASPTCWTPPSDACGSSVGPWFCVRLFLLKLLPCWKECGLWTGTTGLVLTWRPREVLFSEPCGPPV